MDNSTFTEKKLGSTFTEKEWVRRTTDRPYEREILNSIRRHHFEVEEDHDSQKEVLESIHHGQRVTEKKESSF